MNKRSILSLGAAAIVGLTFVVPQTAQAQPGRPGVSANRTAVKSSGRSTRNAIPQASRTTTNRADARGSSNRSYGTTSRGARSGAPSRVSSGNTPRLGDGSLLRELAGNNAQLGDGSLLRELAGGDARLGDGSLLRELAGGYDSPAKYRYKAEEAHADAYRDAAIANAVVGLVGIIAETATANRHPSYSQPVNTAPAGHWETQRVLVQDGHYEKRRVLVPEQRDPRTGEVIEAHYEVRKRFVPPVYEETQVWVRH